MCRSILSKSPPDLSIARLRFLLCALPGLLVALAVLGVSSHSRVTNAAPRFAAHLSHVATGGPVDYRQPDSELLPARAGRRFLRHIVRPRIVELARPSLTSLVAGTGTNRARAVAQPIAPSSSTQSLCLSEYPSTRQPLSWFASRGHLDRDVNACSAAACTSGRSHAGRHRQFRLLSASQPA